MAWIDLVAGQVFENTYFAIKGLAFLCQLSFVRATIAKTLLAKD